MALRFSGTTEELKTRLDSMAKSGSWTEINPNQYQFRHPNGGVLNWYPSTGAINFQGQPAGRNALQAEVTALLQGKESTPSSVTAPTPSLVPGTPIHTVEAVVEKKTTSYPAASASELRNFPDSEIVIGLVGAVGTDMDVIITLLKDRLKIAGYDTTEIRVSREIIPKLVKADVTGASEAIRIATLMDAGDRAREQSGDNAILATGVAAHIASLRKPSATKMPRHAFIVNSLKHPDEVHRLRQIYPRGFNLFGVHPDEKVRLAFMKRKGISDTDIERLIERDQDEHLPFGQRVNDTFHMSDFFVRLENDRLKLENSIIRIFHILFGDPYKTPTFEEFAMFLAFTSSLRSADLSRQVGAVVTNAEEILATGANDCPKFNGGLYWPELNVETHVIEDKKDGRDYMRGEDSNKIEQRKIIDGILDKAKARGLDIEKLKEVLEESGIRDVTEYGRVVHAEMEALLGCARNNVSTRGGQLFSTTFPCHNCAKHIVSAGIQRVVFIEPYQKSKAAEFHSDSISVGFSPSQHTVHFEPFVGIGPRRFFDLFSIRLGAGYELKRKNSDGLVIDWKLSNSSKLRVQMLPGSYLDLEQEAKQQFEKHHLSG
jgi:deoxycytidylate deaminase